MDRLVAATLIIGGSVLGSAYMLTQSPKSPTPAQSNYEFYSSSAGRFRDPIILERSTGRTWIMAKAKVAEDIVKPVWVPVTYHLKRKRESGSVFPILPDNYIDLTKDPALLEKVEREAKGNAQ